MRDKSAMSKNAVFADIVRKLGLELSKIKLWEQYLLLVETVGSTCELADKAASLLVLDEKLIPILKELEEFYGKYSTNKS
jgi:hypothetical protein